MKIEDYRERIDRAKSRHALLDTLLEMEPSFVSEVIPIVHGWTDEEFGAFREGLARERFDIGNTAEWLTNYGAVLVPPPYARLWEVQEQALIAAIQNCVGDTSSTPCEIEGDRTVTSTYEDVVRFVIIAVPTDSVDELVDGLPEDAVVLANKAGNLDNPKRAVRKDGTVARTYNVINASNSNTGLRDDDNHPVDVNLPLYIADIDGQPIDNVRFGFNFHGYIRPADVDAARSSMRQAADKTNGETQK